MLDGLPTEAMHPRTPHAPDFTPDELPDLARIGRVLAGDLPAILDRFYERLSKEPEWRRMIEGTGGPERLKKAQAAHWHALFKDPTSPEFEAGARAAGLAHYRIGLAPEAYLAGYRRLTAEMVQALLRRERNDAVRSRLQGLLVRAVFHDVSLSLHAYFEASNSEMIKREMMTLSDMLEREATNTIGEVGHKAAKFHQISRDVADRSTELKNIVSELADATGNFAEDLRTIAASAEELTALSLGIEQQVSQSAATSSHIMQLSQETRTAVETLNQATGQISSFVNLIRSVASQTKMLSLNATIEAARAGEMGKGFAVVAQEVKGLANQTESSIAEINTQTTAITRSSEDTGDNIAKIDSAISEMDGVSNDIAEAVGQQLIATKDITELMTGAASTSTQVADSMNDIACQADGNLKSALSLADISHGLSEDMDRLRVRLFDIVRSSTVADEHLRVPVAMETRFSDGHNTATCMLVDLSPAGAMLRFDDEAQPARVQLGALSTLSIENIGTCKARSIMPAEDTLHVQFEELTADQDKLIRDIIRTTHARDEKLGGMCKSGATEIAQVLSDGIRAGRVQKSDLFSEDYTPIPGTDPEQFDIPYVSFTDQAITGIQDKVQNADADIIFACSIDRNAFIATHNSNYSQPQRPDDPVWNAAHCRNRRFFSDKAGMLAAHNRQEVLTQTYARDMGGGVKVFLKEVDSPILIDGDFWGNLRIGYKI